MTVGEIKIQALKLMFVSYSDDLSPKNLIDLEGQENYRPYLVNMNGAIDRCLSDIESRCVLPVRVQKLSADPLERSSDRYYTRIDIPFDDFYEVERISKESLYEYEGELDFQREGNTLIIADYDASAEYRLIYYPRVKRSATMLDTDEIDLPENIAALVPYYVKGDLFREDEPNEASEARNWYEAGIEAIKRPIVSRSNKVKSTFSQVW